MLHCRQTTHFTSSGENTVRLQAQNTHNTADTADHLRSGVRQGTISASESRRRGQLGTSTTLSSRFFLVFFLYFFFARACVVNLRFGSVSSGLWRRGGPEPAAAAKVKLILGTVVKGRSLAASRNANPFRGESRKSFFLVSALKHTVSSHFVVHKRILHECACGAERPH